MSSPKVFVVDGVFIPAEGKKCGKAGGWETAKSKGQQAGSDFFLRFFGFLSCSDALLDKRLQNEQPTYDEVKPQAEIQPSYGAGARLHNSPNRVCNGERAKCEQNKTFELSEHGNSPGNGPNGLTIPKEIY
jgi:hypothetical protein